MERLFDGALGWRLGLDEGKVRIVAGDCWNEGIIKRFWGNVGVYEKQNLGVCFGLSQNSLQALLG